MMGHRKNLVTLDYLGIAFNTHFFKNKNSPLASYAYDEAFQKEPSYGTWKTLAVFIF